MASNKKQWEISLWEDMPTTSAIKVNEDDDSRILREEKKIAVLASSNIKTPYDIYDINITKNITGEKTLTFKIADVIIENGVKKEHPFLALLSAERLIKIREGAPYEEFPIDKDITDLELINSIENYHQLEDNEDKWSDFIIKTIDEDSTGHIKTYTCKETYVNTLGKNGWSITFDNELENNFGTLEELTKTTLKGSNWEYDNTSYIPIVTQAEQLFYYTIPSGSTYSITNVQDNSLSKNIGEGDTIYFFYSDVTYNIKNKSWETNKTGSMQILFKDTKDIFSKEDTDDNNIIVDGEGQYNYFINLDNILSLSFNASYPILGEKIIQNAKVKLDTVLDKYVDIYKDENNKEVYHYINTTYFVPKLLENHIINNKDFISTLQWYNNYTDDSLQLDLNGDRVETILDGYTPQYNILKVKSKETIYNYGPKYTRLAPIEGEEYVIELNITNPEVIMIDNIHFTLINPNENGENILLDYTPTIYKGNGKCLYTVTIKKTYSPKAYDGLVLGINNNDDDILKIKSIYLYKKYLDNNGNIITINDAPEAEILQEDIYYKYNSEPNSLENIEYLDTTKKYFPVLVENNAAIKSISIKQSNRFNIISSLAELFQVWVEFKVPHFQDGRINYNKKPKIRYKKYKGIDNFSGFKYGINLNGIKRTVDSANIVTKLIVLNNNNEFATDGSASISRANINPSKENYIYNFDYYVNQGLLNYNILLNDLYGVSDKGLYPQLKEYNEKIEKINGQVISYQGQIDYYNSMLEYIDTEISSINNEIAVNQDLLDAYINGGIDNNKKESLQYTLNTLKARLKGIEEDRKTYEENIKYYQAEIDKLTNETSELKQLEKDKDNILSIFFNKYSPYIQEGTWQDESYIDDTLYYIDGLKVSSQNSYPKVSYTINVADISNVSGYENYNFKEGDMTFIEDPYFFGYENIDIPGISTKISTPFKKQVIITEISYSLDNNNNTKITVQTYKNQFEELFSKIVSSTTSLQYASGGYNNASSIIGDSGKLTGTLEDAFANNAWVIANSSDQSVTWDSGRGIIIKDLKNVSNILRLTSNGIALTIDGGKTWTTGITGNGINANFIKTGRLDANLINIMNGADPAFTWDKDGLSAYGSTSDGSTGDGIDMQKAVRFNKYGMFGTTKLSDLEAKLSTATNERDALNIIKKFSNFALTWDGLDLSYQDGSVSLSPQYGLQIFGDDIFNNSFITNGKDIVKSTDENFKEGEKIPLVTLGKFYRQNDINSPKIENYGLSLRNNLGEITLTTNSKGDLWLENTLSIGSTATPKFALMSNIVYANKISLVSNEDGTAKIIFITPTDIFNDRMSFSNKDDIIKCSINYNFNLEEQIEIESIEKIEDSLEWSATFIGSENNETSIYTYLKDNDYFIINFTFKINYENNPNKEDFFSNFSNIFGKIDLDNKMNPPLSMAVGKYSEIDDYEDAPFRLYSDGKLIVSNAEINGFINAKAGKISGLLTLGSNNNIGINGYEESEEKFWVKNGESQFIVKSDGSLIATNADIKGNINATSGTFSGRVEAKEGYINKLFFGEDENSYLSNEENNYININDGAFTVTGNGDVFANILSLNKEAIVIGKNYNIIDIKVKPNNKSVFLVKDSGDLYLKGNINMEGYLKTTNDIKLDGTIRSNIEPSTTGWSIDGSGNAIFNNVSVRGKIETAVFTKKAISAIGGELFISPSIILTEEQEIETDISEGIYYVDLDTGDTKTTDENAVIVSSWGNVYLGVPPEFNSIEEKYIDKCSILINSSDSSLENEKKIEYKYCLYSEENTSNIKIRIFLKTLDNNFIKKDEENKNYMKIGTVVKRTNYSTNSITLSATNPNGSKIIMRGANKINGDLKDSNTVLIGYLDTNDFSSNFRDLFSDIFDSKEPVYGLFADNALITGRVYLPNCGITNEEERISDTWETDTLINYDDENGKYIRFWAGASSKDKSKAPFIVTQDGSLYAEKGTFKGKVIASESKFNGIIDASTIKASEILASKVIIDRDEIEDKDNYKSVFYINSKGLLNPSLEGEKSEIEEVVATFTHKDGLSLYRFNNTTLLDTLSEYKIFSVDREKGSVNVNNLFFPVYSKNEESISVNEKYPSISFYNNLSIGTLNNTIVTFKEEDGCNKMQINLNDNAKDDGVDELTYLEFGDNIRVKLVEDGIVFQYIKTN